jgi:rod shape-determining protein MreD
VRLIAVFSLATIIALALQTTVARLLPLAILMPNLALVLAVNLGLRYYSAAAAVMAFGIGYATDSFSGGRLGLNAALFIVVFVATYGLSRAVLSSTTVVGVIAVFIAVIFVDFGSALVATSWTRSEGLDLATRAVLIQAAITALCAPPVFALMAGATRFLGLRQRGFRD